MFADATFSDITFADFFSSTGTVVYLPRKARTKVTFVTANAQTGLSGYNNIGRTKVKAVTDVEVTSWTVTETRGETNQNNLYKHKLRTYVEPLK